MVRVSVMGAALLVVTGCGGGSSPSGSGGKGGGAGALGSGGSAGAKGAGGAGAQGAGGSGGALPACAVISRPQDPVDSAADGGYHDPRTHVCNTVDPGGAWIVPQGFSWGDAGAASDGGALAGPMGGVLLDGDYDLVRILYPTASPQATRRTFRVFDGGTYIERAVLTQNPSADGGVTGYWYNTTEAPSGTDFGSQSVCGDLPSLDSYTADGDDLTLFVGRDSAPGSAPIGIDIYRRTCTRP